MQNAYDPLPSFSTLNFQQLDLGRLSPKRIANHGWIVT